MKSVYSAVRAGSLNKAVCASYLKGLSDLFTKYVARRGEQWHNSLKPGSGWAYDVGTKQSRLKIGTTSRTGLSRQHTAFIHQYMLQAALHTMSY